MKISQIEIRNFKRFSHLRIENIPDTAKVVLVVGPNGCGKSSLFEAFLHWYRFKFERSWSDNDYYRKVSDQPLVQDNSVRLQFHDLADEQKETLRGKFYFRTAYRNDADFTMSRLDRQPDPTDNIRIPSFIQNDTVVQQNYQRLVSLTLKGVYDPNNEDRRVLDLRDELIGKVKESLQNVFDDLTLTSIGDPLANGAFYFEKGVSKDFHYKNLSGGEKSAFDLLLDLIIKANYYQTAVICIDEPETHMHTRLQSRLFEELYRIVPNGSQLWMNTHSLGMLNRAREIEREHPNTVTFLNFDSLDFDKSVIITPSRVDRTIWDRFVEITLDDLSDLLAPRKVVFCEGDQRGRKYQNFDAQIFGKIFQNQYPDYAFISIGSASELENQDNITVKIVQGVLRGSQISKVVDRDDRSPDQVAELNQQGIRVLNRRHIESYLLDDTLITKLCQLNGQADLVAELLRIKQEKITDSINRGNPADDIKSASGDIFVEIKRRLRLVACGNSKDAFLRDTIAPLVTEDTEIYQALEREILL